MKNLFPCLVAFGLSALVAVAGGEKKAAPKIEGSWTVTGGSSEGKKVPDEVLAKAMLKAVFKDGAYKVTSMDKQLEAGTYQVDGAKNPATIDMKITEGEDKGKNQLGIYKFEGEVLTIALGSAGSTNRPKNFDGGDKIEITVMKRAK